MTDRVVCGSVHSVVSPKWQPCQVCRKSSPQVYEQGWMCLKPECKQFWTFSSGQCPPAALTYSEAFLQPRPGFKARTDDIRPPLPVKSDEITGPTTSYHFCKGWHCTGCGRLSSRYRNFIPRANQDLCCFEIQMGKLGVQ